METTSFPNTKAHVYISTKREMLMYQKDMIRRRKGMLTTASDNKLARNQPRLNGLVQTGNSKLGPNDPNWIGPSITSLYTVRLFHNNLSICNK